MGYALAVCPYKLKKIDCIRPKRDLYNIIPCAGMQCVKTQVLWNRCTIKHSFWSDIHPRVFENIILQISTGSFFIVKVNLQSYNKFVKNGVFWNMLAFTMNLATRNS